MEKEMIDVNTEPETHIIDDKQIISELLADVNDLKTNQKLLNWKIQTLLDNLTALYSAVKHIGKQMSKIVDEE